MTPETSRADRILVWLMLAGMVLGGLATTVVAFSAEGVLAGMSATATEDHDASGGEQHQDAGDDHADAPAGHDMTMSTSTAPSSQGHDMTMPMQTPTP